MGLRIRGGSVAASVGSGMPASISPSKTIRAQRDVSNRSSTQADGLYALWWLRETPFNDYSTSADPTISAYKYCTSRSCFSAAARLEKVPRFLRFPSAPFLRE